MLSPTAPNELNYALPWLLMGQIKKNFRILSIQKGKDGLGLKTISRYCPFKCLVRGLTLECLCVSQGVTATKITEQYTYDYCHKSDDFL
jgi:hypothetical protein